MEIGLVGLPLTGKTTFFNLLTGMEHETGLGKKRDVNTATANIPDDRVYYLARLYRPKKTIFAQIQIKDIPGIHPGDVAGMANKQLEEVRSSDLLVQVVRAFRHDIVNNTIGKPDPYKELIDFAADLSLADMISIEKKIYRLEKPHKSSRDAQLQKKTLQAVLEILENGQRISDLNLTAEEKNVLAGHNFLTEKPIIVAVNLDEEQFSAGTYDGRDKILKFANERQIPLLEICGRLEMEINQLSPCEKEEFMQDLGLTESGIRRLAQTAYKLLDLYSFFTVGADEVRAWTIKKGTTAKKAAGKVHSDMERGFIRAEVVNFEEMKKLGSIAAVREKGLFRLEGKEYEVKDGDIISFRFNV